MDGCIILGEGVLFFKSVKELDFDLENFLMGEYIFHRLSWFVGKLLIKDYKGSDLGGGGRREKNWGSKDKRI